MKCWGWNSYGQLGDGSTVDRTAPVIVQGLAGATQLSAGSAVHLCDRERSGSLLGMERLRSAW
ncbi:MAG: hypothetical protein ACOYOB_18870 [Myxococcota bacterium]